MVPDGFPVGAAVLLAVSAVLLANPLYLQEDETGNQIVLVEETTPAEGLAQRSPAVRQSDDLPVVARYATRQRLADESFRVERDGPPLALQLLGREGRYVASHRAAQLYEPTVTIGANRTTLSLAPVAVETVEDELGLTPPASLESNHTLRRIAWVADRADAVYAVGQFGERCEHRMEDAVAAGELTVPNGNDAETLAPLGGDVAFVVEEGTAYRATVESTDQAVRLVLAPVSTERLLSETDVTTVTTDSLSPGTRAVVVEAIRDEDGYTRFAREDVDREELTRLTEGLVRHEGEYYVLQRSHVDGFSLVPLARVVLMAFGGIIGFVGVFLLYREKGWARPDVE